MTYKEIRKNKEINAYIKKGNDNLGVLGYTDHSQIHCTLVAERAALILEKFGYGEHETELARIAGYMHDIGNSINRKQHAEYGALLANELLRQTDMSLDDRVTVVSAIANHDESTGGAVDVISAALVIADKTDVRRDRVRAKEKSSYDIHDRAHEGDRRDAAEHSGVHEAEHIGRGGLSREDGASGEEFQHARHADQSEDLPDGVEYEEEHDRQERLMIGKAVADGDWRVKVQTSGQK